MDEETRRPIIPGDKPGAWVTESPLARLVAGTENSPETDNLYEFIASSDLKKTRSHGLDSADPGAEFFFIPKLRLTLFFG